MMSDRRFEYRLYATSSIKAEAEEAFRELIYECCELEGIAAREERGRSRRDEELEERTTTSRTAEYPL
jgi:hypothetical protein